MSAPILASLIALLPNLLIALHALFGWLKMGDRTRLLMLILFGGSVIGSLLGLAATIAYLNGGVELVLLSKISAALTLVAVYAFFLFMAEFAPVRPWLHYAILVVLLALVGWEMLVPLTYTQTRVGVQVAPPRELLGAEVAYYFVLLIVIAVRFWQHSFALVGLSRKRVQAIALGTTIAILSVVPALSTQGATADVQEIGSWIGRAIGLTAGVIYYLGFATPRWLREIWTSAERRRIGDLSLATAGGRAPEALLQDVLSTAIEVSGAQGGALALVDERSHELKLQANSGLPEQLVAPLLADGDRFLKRPGLERSKPIITRPRVAPSATLPPAKLNAVMDTPMFLGDTFVGVIRLVADRSLVFEEEDATIMQVLGAQAAVSLDTALRLAEVRAEAQRAGQLYNEAGFNLRQRASELRAVLGSMADGLYVVDPAGRIILINRVAAEMAGTTEPEALGKPAHEVLGFALDHAALIEPALQRGEATPHQETTLRAGGTEIPINIVASPLFDDEQQPRGVVINFRDISTEKEAQRVKDEFIATVSHELRTPLTAILGYADLMLRGTPEPATPRQKAQLQAIRNNGSRLLTLINDLLDLSKIEAGQVTLNLKPISVPNVISRSLGGLQVLINNKKLSVETDIPINLPLVLADFDRLSQIMDNLLSNAIKFTPIEGKIKVSAALLADADNGPSVRVQVADSGIGIEAEHLERIWDRFYQVESSATRRFGGTGLGLSIVKHLVEMHGGQLAASSPGKDLGSMFSFSVPVAEAVLAAERPRRTPEQAVEWLPPQQDQPLDLSKPLVLIADDDPYFVHIMRTQLENEGYRIAEASDGVEAVRLARELQPFAITLDVQLPRVDGWSVLNQLKRDPATQGIPVVIMSVVDNREFGLTLGASEYLVKPIDHARLLDTLHRLTFNQNNGASVLVVEDDDDVRNMLHQALEQGPWHTSVARDGNEALAALQHEKPGVVILDLMMPNMDGFEVLTRMRANPDTAKIPVIILTAKELTEEEISFLNRTAQRLILKQGHDIDQLIEEVRRTLAAWRESTVRS